MDIVKRITELREEAGENRKEFSAHTGIPVRTLEDWEAGRRTPSEYIARTICGRNFRPQIGMPDADILDYKCLEFEAFIIKRLVF